jgi:hypothetical protein
LSAPDRLLINDGRGHLTVKSDVRIDPRTNRVTHRFSGSAGGMVLAGHHAVWVAGGQKLTWRIDAKLIASLRP